MDRDCLMNSCSLNSCLKETISSHSGNDIELVDLILLFLNGNALTCFETKIH